MSKWLPPLLLLSPGFAQSGYIAHELKIIWLQRCSLLHNALVRKHREGGKYSIYKSIYMKYGLGVDGEDRPSVSRVHCHRVRMFRCLSFPWRCLISQHSPQGLHFKNSSVICWAKQRTAFMYSLLWKTKTGSYFFLSKVGEKLHIAPPWQIPNSISHKWKMNILYLDFFNGLDATQSKVS